MLHQNILPQFELSIQIELLNSVFTVHDIIEAFKSYFLWCEKGEVSVIFTWSLAGAWNLTLPFGTLMPAVNNEAGEVITMEIISTLVSSC